MEKIEWHLEKRKLSSLKNDPKNPRLLSKDDEQNLQKSIDKFGLIDKPCITPSGLMIGGHQRKKILKKMGLKEVECWVPSRELTDKEVDELNIRLNRNTGEWDYDKLAEWKTEDLLEWGFRSDELPTASLNELLGEEDESTSLEPVKDAISKLGDVYELNGHRVVCGDSTDSVVVTSCLKGEKPILMVTDPPYGVEYDAEWKFLVGRKKYKTKSIGKVVNDGKSDWTASYALFPGSVAYVWHTALHSDSFFKGLVDCGFEIKYQIVWVKQAGFGRGDYHWYHEPCFYAVKKGFNHNWNGDRKQRTVWEIQSRSALGDTTNMEDFTGHSTQKPLECMARPIRNNTKQGEGVYDPFLGSGTTLIAAEKLDRTCYGIEISHSYVDVTVNRWVRYMKKNSKPFILKKNGEEIEWQDQKQT